jgi:hypothetical protein
MEALKEARATAIQAVKNSGAAEILDELQLRQIPDGHTVSTVDLQVVEKSHAKEVHPRARR